MALPPRKINFDDVYGPINAAEPSDKADLRVAIGLNDAPEGALAVYIHEDHAFTANDKPLLRVREILPDGRVVFDPADIDIGEYPTGEDFAVVGYLEGNPTDQVLIPASSMGSGGGGFTGATNTEVLQGVNTTKGVTPDGIAALWEKGGNITAASSIAIGEGGFFHVTGATTINGITFTTDKAGRSAGLYFESALTLTHGANLIVSTGATYNTAAGELVMVLSEGGGVVRAFPAGATGGGGGGGGGVGLIQGEIYAHEMTASNTSGAAPIFAETATNQRMIVAWAFDSAADEYVQTAIGLPKRYNNGTLTFQFHWTQETTNATASVTWCVEALATGNADAINAAWGAAQRVVDDGGTAQTHYISGATPALTPAGTHAAGDMLRLRFSRDVDGNGTAGNDDLAQDAQLERVTYWYTSSASTDA